MLAARCARTTAELRADDQVPSRKCRFPRGSFGWRALAYRSRPLALRGPARRFCCPGSLWPCAVSAPLLERARAVESALVAGLVTTRDGTGRRGAAFVSSRLRFSGRLSLWRGSRPSRCAARGSDSVLSWHSVLRTLFVEFGVQSPPELLALRPDILTFRSLSSPPRVPDKAESWSTIGPYPTVGLSNPLAVGCAGTKLGLCRVELPATYP